MRKFIQVVFEKVVIFTVVSPRFCPAVFVIFSQDCLYVVVLLIHHDVALFRDE